MPRIEKPGKIAFEGDLFSIRPVRDIRKKTWWKVQFPLTREEQADRIASIAEKYGVGMKVNHGSHWGFAPCCEIMVPMMPQEYLGNLLDVLANVMSDKEV